jgi:hypothetical protein
MLKVAYLILTLQPLDRIAQNLVHDKIYWKDKQRLLGKTFVENKKQNCGCMGSILSCLFDSLTN